MSYECKTTFSSITGTRFHKGETISLSQLSDLPAEERAYFRRTGSSELSRDSDDEPGILDTALDIGIGIGLSSLFNSDSDSSGSSDSGSSFDGFGGGDFGGGGASDDF